MAGFCVRAADVVMCLSWCRRTCTGALGKRRIDTLGRALAMDLVSVAVLCGSHVCTAHEPSIGAFGRSIASQSRAKGRWPDRPCGRRWLQCRAHSSSATSSTRPWASTARAVAAPAARPTGMEMVTRPMTANALWAAEMRRPATIASSREVGIRPRERVWQARLCCSAW